MIKNKRLICILIVMCLVLTVVFAACSFVTPRLSVIYDRTHTVYEGDTLDSLRPYLTVKHTDFNGNRKTVDDYTLSGELTLGESTFSVHYKGLIQTVHITVEAYIDDGNGGGGDGGNGDGGNDKTDEESVTLSVASNSVVVGASTQIYISTTPTGQEDQVVLEMLQGGECAYLNGNELQTYATGTCVIVGKMGEVVSNQLVINVIKNSSPKVTITLSVDKTFIERNDYTNMTVNVVPSSYASQVNYRFIEGAEHATRIGNSVSIRGDSGGIVKVQAYIEDCVSNVVSFQVVNPADDPYKNVNWTSFHNNNYKPATSLEDSYWRTQHNLMSGDISDQDQKPTTATNQPKSGNKFIRNNDTYYVDNGNTWEVVDSRGKVVNRIYKFGAYVTLEDVAAYVYAFGDVPANYINDNDTSLLSGNAWGKYLRLNHTYFSGNTSRYPYEPELPRISGIGNGDLRYYEIDIGTTGTDCDPSYDAVIYNNGSRIVRGAARIVYSRYYRNGNYDGEHIDNLEERYVFYTYNHYNDFQEYLNYQGGWGEIFGNITGGGTISSKSNYNPTPYVQVVRQSFTS